MVENNGQRRLMELRAETLKNTLDTLEDDSRLAVSISNELREIKAQLAESEVAMRQL